MFNSIRNIRHRTEKQFNMFFLHIVYTKNIISSYCFYTKYYLNILFIQKKLCLHIVSTQNIISTYCFYTKYYLYILFLHKMVSLNIVSSQNVISTLLFPHKCYLYILFIQKILSLHYYLYTKCYLYILFLHKMLSLHIVYTKNVISAYCFYTKWYLYILFLHKTLSLCTVFTQTFISTLCFLYKILFLHFGFYFFHCIKSFLYILFFYYQFFQKYNFATKLFLNKEIRFVLFEWRRYELGFQNLIKVLISFFFLNSKRVRVHPSQPGNQYFSYNKSTNS